MPCPISLLFINLHGSRYLGAARLCPGAGGGGRSSAGRSEHRGLCTAPWGPPRSSPKTRGTAGVCSELQPCEGESPPGRRGKGAAGGSGLWDVHGWGVGALALTPPGWAALCPSAGMLGIRVQKLGKNLLPWPRAPCFISPVLLLSIALAWKQEREIL